jgi:hypothetical protein
LKVVCSRPWLTISRPWLTNSRPWLKNITMSFPSHRSIPYKRWDIIPSHVILQKPGCSGTEDPFGSGDSNTGTGDIATWRCKCLWDWKRTGVVLEYIHVRQEVVPGFQYWSRGPTRTHHQSIRQFKPQRGKGVPGGTLFDTHRSPSIRFHWAETYPHLSDLVDHIQGLLVGVGHDIL